MEKAKTMRQLEKDEQKEAEWEEEERSYVRFTYKVYSKRSVHCLEAVGYKRKLSCYDFTVYDLGSGEGTPSSTWQEYGLVWKLEYRTLVGACAYIICLRQWR